MFPRLYDTDERGLTHTPWDQQFAQEQQEVSHLVQNSNSRQKTPQ